MKRSYKYVLLDWDGNLAKTLDVWLEATQVPLKNRNIIVDDADVVHLCFGRPSAGYAELGINDIDRAIEEMDGYAKQKMPEVELYPDTLFVLDELKKMGKKLALITSSRRNNVIHLLEKYNILGYFSVIIANEDTERHKPDPEPLEKALQTLGAQASEAIMIGDSDKDIGAAINAGADSILFYPEEHQKFYNADYMQGLGATYIIDDFRAVIGIV
jgi:pyrophosphatase PpaX